MVLVDGKGLPLGMLISSANRAECQLAVETLDKTIVKRQRSSAKPRRPKRIIADKAYDSRLLWEQMARRGVELIVPHRRTRKESYQDGRKLRRYRRRWIVERTFAWLFNFRRIFVRYEREARLFRAFICLAFALIVLRRF